MMSNQTWKNIENTSTSGDYTQVFSDGATIRIGNGIQGGIGVWFGTDNPSNLSAPVSGKVCKHTAKIQAAVKAIELAQEQGITKLCINTDSEFLVQLGNNWMSEWKSSGWIQGNGDRIVSIDEIKHLDKAITDSGISVRWNYVPSHSGMEGIKQAVALARAGAYEYSGISNSQELDSRSAYSRSNYDRYY